jgi:hypothetical protein
MVAHHRIGILQCLKEGSKGLFEFTRAQYTQCPRSFLTYGNVLISHAQDPDAGGHTLVTRLLPVTLDAAREEDCHATTTDRLSHDDLLSLWAGGQDSGTVVAQFILLATS